MLCVSCSPAAAGQLPCPAEVWAQLHTAGCVLQRERRVHLAVSCHETRSCNSLHVSTFLHTQSSEYSSVLVNCKHTAHAFTAESQQRHRSAG